MRIEHELEFELLFGNLTSRRAHRRDEAELESVADDFSIVGPLTMVRVSR
ncbi:hypothetical protein [Fodinibacter luteus]